MISHGNNIVITLNYSSKTFLFVVSHGDNVVITLNYSSKYYLLSSLYNFPFCCLFKFDDHGGGGRRGQSFQGPWPTLKCGGKSCWGDWVCSTTAVQLCRWFQKSLVNTIAACWLKKQTVPETPELSTEHDGCQQNQTGAYAWYIIHEQNEGHCSALHPPPPQPISSPFLSSLP